MMKAMSELLKHKPCQRDSILDRGEISKQLKPAVRPFIKREERRDGI